jgi:colanic acid/amylovoran biosynthesis glycosyltransferase
MTFIRSHSEAMKRHVAVYAGAHRVAGGLSLPCNRTILANEGGVSGHLHEFLFRRLQFAPAFLRRLEQYEPVAVHSHFGESGPPGLTIAKALGVPLIVTFHGKDAMVKDEENATSWRGRQYLRQRAELADKAARFIAVSVPIRERLVQQGFPRKKILVHRNGIDTSYFSPDAMPREPVVLFVGRFVEKKGCEYLIESMRLLKCNGIEATLVLIGDGPLRPDLERRVSEAGASVRFEGFLPLDKVRMWMNRATVVAVPSVTAANGDSEGLPTVMLEAQAMSAPVVATRHSGNPEGVVEGSTAMLVPERDAPALANALREFLANPEKARNFGESARRFVVENFEIAKQVAGLEDIYEHSYK